MCCTVGYVTMLKDFVKFHFYCLFYVCLCICTSRHAMSCHFQGRFIMGLCQYPTLPYSPLPTPYTIIPKPNFVFNSQLPAPCPQSQPRNPIYPIPSHPNTLNDPSGSDSSLCLDDVVLRLLSRGGLGLGLVLLLRWGRWDRWVKWLTVEEKGY